MPFELLLALVGGLGGIVCFICGWYAASWYWYDEDEDNNGDKRD